MGFAAGLGLAVAVALFAERTPQAIPAPSRADIVLAADAAAREMPAETTREVTPVKLNKPAPLIRSAATAPTRSSVEPVRQRRRPENLPTPTGTSGRDRQPQRSTAVVSAPTRPAPARQVNAPALESKAIVAYRAVAPAALPSLPPQPAASLVAATPVAPPVRDETAVRSLLERYRGAYERLDADAAKMIWPKVDERRLARAFSDLDAQSMTFDACRIDVGSTRGVASCRGRTTYVARVGNKSAHTQNRTWTFQLEKAGDGWTIDSVRLQ